MLFFIGVIFLGSARRLCTVPVRTVFVKTFEKIEINTETLA